MGSVQERLYDQEIHKVVIPEDVRKTEEVTKEMIAEAAAFLHKDGIVVLENAIDTAHIDKLNEILSKDAMQMVSDPELHFNFNEDARNIDTAPPPRRDLMFKDVWCNPFAAAVCAAMLGPQPVIHYANGNTALKATGRQPVHSDSEFTHPQFPFALVLNIYLVDASPENGSTELWPGSHHCSTVDDHVSNGSGEYLLDIKQDLVEARRKHSPPVQPTVKKGSLIIRDLRLWHAGMPNKTDEPRIMLAFVAQPAWFEGRSKVILPTSVKDLIASWNSEFQFDADWVDGDVDHTKLSSADVDFDSKSRVLEKYRHELAHRPAYSPAMY